MRTQRYAKRQTTFQPWRAPASNDDKGDDAVAVAAAAAAAHLGALGGVSRRAETFPTYHRVFHQCLPIAPLVVLAFGRFYVMVRGCAGFPRYSF